MTEPLFIKPQNVRDLDGPFDARARELFYDNTRPPRFVALIEELRSEGLNFNGLHSNGYTIGWKALSMGDYEPIDALAAADYNFALDPVALEFAAKAWHGMFYRTVAKAAHKFDPTVQVPTIEEEAAAEQAEMSEPSFRSITPRFRWARPGSLES